MSEKIIKLDPQKETFATPNVEEKKFIQYLGEELNKSNPIGFRGNDPFKVQVDAKKNEISSPSEVDTVSMNFAIERAAEKYVTRILQLGPNIDKISKR